VARLQLGGSAGPDAPEKELVGPRPGFRSSFILCRTMWQASGVTASVKLPAISTCLAATKAGSRQLQAESGCEPLHPFTCSYG